MKTCSMMVVADVDSNSAIDVEENGQWTMAHVNSGDRTSRIFYNFCILHFTQFEFQLVGFAFWWDNLLAEYLIQNGTTIIYQSSDWVELWRCDIYSNDRRKFWLHDANVLGACCFFFKLKMIYVVWKKNDLIFKWESISEGGVFLHYF